ncbi:MAG: hypothetical protein IH599_08925, partial [Bacteroidales bacterium]|nr:hypothetical protein [Bacteroidales bacterium]
GMLNGGLANNIPGAGQTQTQVMSGHIPSDRLSMLGQLYRYYRVVIEDPYYLSPDHDFSLAPGGSQNATLRADVRSYDLDLQVTADATVQQAAGVNAPIDGAECFLMRKANAPPSLPDHEGQQLTETKNIGAHTLEVVGKSLTDGQGRCRFERLLRHHPYDASDDYVIWIETQERGGSLVYKNVLDTWPDFPAWEDYRLDAHPLVPASYAGTNAYYTFNNEYFVQTFYNTLKMHPDKPRIAGRVMVKTAPLAGVKCYTNHPADGVVYTDLDGYFSFDKLDIISTSRKLYFAKYGYESKSIDNIGQLIAGNQKWYPNIEMTPWGNIKGYITDASGNALEAYVQVDSLTLYPTQHFVNFMTQKAYENFLFRAPSGSRTLHVIPVSTEYQPYDTTVVLQKKNASDTPQNLGQIILKKKMHRIRIMVRTPDPGQSTSSPVVQATVSILGHEAKTNNRGLAILEFSSPETHFELKVTPPDGSDLVPAVFGHYNVPSAELQNRTVYLEKGFSIHGTVRAGTNNNGLAGARVFVMSAGNPPIEVWTAPFGGYVLKGIPENGGQDVWVCAVKESGSVSYVGEKKAVKKTDSQVDFHLDVVTDIDLTTIWGLPVEIEEYKQTKAGRFISGAFVHLPGQMGISTEDENYRLPFTNLKIQFSQELNAQGVPHAEPVATEAISPCTRIPVEVFSRWKASFLSDYPVSGVFMFTQKQLRVRPDAQGKGYLRGRLYLEEGAFSLSAEALSFEGEEEMNLSPLNATEPYITGFKVADGGMASQMYLAKLRLTDRSGGNSHFKLLGFETSAESGQSFLETDGLRMALEMTPDYPLADFSNAPLKTSTAVVKSDRIVSFSNPSPISFKLEDWTVECPSGWNYDATTGRLKAANVKIHTSIVSLTASELRIFHDRLDFSGMNYSTMSLGGVAPLTIASDAESWFYLDPNISEDKGKHYVFKLIGPVGGYAASVSGLPGLSGTIKIPTLQIVSNGESMYSGFESLNDKVFFHNILGLQLQMISAGQGWFKLSGLYDLRTPDIRSDRTGELKFLKSGAQITTEVVPLNLDFDGPGQVRFEAGRLAGDQTLNTQEYKADGKLIITDKGKTLALDATFHRKPGLNGAAWVQVTQENISLGNLAPRLKINAGEMRVSGGNWGYLWVEGPIENAAGLSQNGNSQKTKFTVKGAINADETSVSVTSLPGGPMGALKLTYNLESGEFLGSCSMPQRDIGPVKFGGDLHLRFGPLGWYFLGGGSGQLPVLGGMNKMAFLIGDYKDTQAFLDELDDYTMRKSLPFGSTFNGIFVSGKKNDIAGIQLPDLHIDLKVSSLDLESDVSIAMDLYKQFNTSPVFNYGARGRANVTLELEFLCADVSMSTGVDILGHGTANLLNPVMPVNSLHLCSEMYLSGSVDVCGIGGSVSKHLKFLLDMEASGLTPAFSAKIREGSCE